MMMASLLSFSLEEEGQDLIEYTLLVALVCVLAAGIAPHVAVVMEGIWSKTAAELQKAP